MSGELQVRQNGQPVTDEKKNMGFSGLSSLASEVDEVTLQAKHKQGQISRRGADSQRSDSSGTPTTSVPSTAPSPSLGSKPEVVAAGSAQVPRTGASGSKWFWLLVGVGVLIWLLNGAQQNKQQVERRPSLTPTSQTPATAGECGQWCEAEYWETATLAGVQADIAAGVDVHARTEYDATPLHRAAAFNVDEAIISVLVEAGADVHARTEGGWTPLHLAAAFNENPDVITVLLKTGADLKAKDSSGKTPFDYVRENEKLKDWEDYWRLNYLQPQ